ncbi:MAG: threonine/homoserine/homoserine lactone efflux protein [Haloarculaceae archaeon]|jgi:threonine/homoserine/homoserine lactone efflux protein
MVLQLVTTFGAGVVFGLALAAPPGPMNAIIAEESVLRGWLAGFKAGLGAMSADMCFLGLSLAGAVAIVEDLPTLRAVMVGVGGLLMLYFAYDAASDARATLAPETDATVESKGFRKAFVLALTNPYQILFWLTVGVGLLQDGTHDLLAETPYLGDLLAGALVVQTGSIALLVGLFGGILVWIVGFPAALVAAGRRVDRLAPVVAVVSALVLGGFGVAFLLDATATLL